MSSPFSGLNHLVRVAPSALGELASAVHLLQRQGGGRGGPHIWREQIRARRPDLTEELVSWWPDTAKLVPRGSELLWIGAYSGGVIGEDLDDFFDRFNESLALLSQERAIAEQARDPNPDRTAIRIDRVEELRRPDVQNRYVRLMRDVWNELAPIWERDGLPVVRLECARLRQRLDDGGNLLELLPAKHFIQFDEYAAIVHDALEKRRPIIVTPLHFAGGGYLMDLDDEHTPIFIGYGCRLEGVHKALAQRAADVAGRLKALSDPTRLALLATLGELDVTVGDMAKLLEISQPTVSGHLKVLQGADLVTVRKKGVKSFYKADAEAIETLLRDARDLLQ